MTLAKGLGSGVPIGACLAQGAAAGRIQAGQSRLHFRRQSAGLRGGADDAGSDRGAKTCASMPPRSAQFIRDGLSNAAGWHGRRGRDPRPGPDDRHRTRPPLRRTGQAGAGAGLLINVTADTVVRLLPPLVMKRDEAQQLVDMLRAADQGLSRAEHNAPPVASMQIKHFLQFKDLTRDEFEYLFERTRWIKEQFKAYQPYRPLHDRTLVMIFEKASTRTRLSFEAGMQQLGGAAIYLNTRDSQLGRGEPVEDAAQVISRMSDIVMIRTFEQEIIERFAANSRVPVINGLTNEYHPARSWPTSTPTSSIAARSRARPWRGSATPTTSATPGCRRPKCSISTCTSPRRPAMKSSRSAPACTATTTTRNSPTRWKPRAAPTWSPPTCGPAWASKRENEERKRDFDDWQVDADMMRVAKPDALFMHCLPAHRGEEVAAEVIDGPQSVVWDEAENRLHAQKALMEYLLLGKINR